MALTRRRTSELGVEVQGCCGQLFKSFVSSFSFCLCHLSEYNIVSVSSLLPQTSLSLLPYLFVIIFLNARSVPLLITCCVCCSVHDLHDQLHTLYPNVPMDQVFGNYYKQKGTVQHHQTTSAYAMQLTQPLYCYIFPVSGANPTYVMAGFCLVCG